MQSPPACSVPPASAPRRSLRRSSASNPRWRIRTLAAGCSMRGSHDWQKSQGGPAVHELSIAQSLIELVMDTLVERGAADLSAADLSATSVAAVHVRIGQ